jgi:hypothetical protein
MKKDREKNLSAILREINFIAEAKKKKNKKPKPTKPDLWSQVKSEAKKKFDVYPSAYANLWASKKYKERGGGWRMSSSSDDEIIDYEGDIENDLKIVSSTMETNLKDINIELQLSFEIEEDLSIDIIDDMENCILDELEKEIFDYIKNISKKDLFFSIKTINDSISINIKISPEIEENINKVIYDENNLEDFENKLLDSIERGFSKFMRDEYNSENFAKDNYKGGLRKWLKEKWVDVSRKDKSGKHPPCGRSDSDKGAYPKCRPSKKVDKKTPETSKSMSKSEKEKATTQKRRAEKKNPKSGKGNKPTYTSHKK